MEFKQQLTLIILYFQPFTLVWTDILRINLIAYFVVRSINVANILAENRCVSMLLRVVTVFALFILVFNINLYSERLFPWLILTMLLIGHSDVLHSLRILSLRLLFQPWSLLCPLR